MLTIQRWHERIKNWKPVVNSQSFPFITAHTKDNWLEQKLAAPLHQFATRHFQHLRLYDTRTHITPSPYSDACTSRTFQAQQPMPPACMYVRNQRSRFNYAMPLGDKFVVVQLHLFPVPVDDLVPRVRTQSDHAQWHLALPDAQQAVHRHCDVDVV